MRYHHPKGKHAKGEIPQQSPGNFPPHSFEKLRINCARERGVIHGRRNPAVATVIALRYLILIFRRSCQRRRGLKGGRRRLRNSLIPSSEVPPRNKERENESHLVCIPFSVRCRSRNGNFDCDYVGAQYLREKVKEGGGGKISFWGCSGREN